MRKKVMLIDIQELQLKVLRGFLFSEAVRQGWPIVAADISKAFLQGVTYEELAELTGEQPHEVQSAPILWNPNG